MNYDSRAHSLTDAILQLRQSALHAVVTGTEFTGFQQALRIEDGLSTWLQELLAEAQLKGKARPYDLVVLSGNAGDGKSALLASLMKSLRPEVRAEFKVIEDATHTDSPGETLSKRLFEFFAPFADDRIDVPPAQGLHLIAMNIGAVRRFFDRISPADASRFQRLRQALFAALHLPYGGSPETTESRILVINLDLRRLLGLPGRETESFFRSMVSQLSPDGEALSPYSEACRNCSGRHRCFVRQNLTLLQDEAVQERLERLLWKVSLSGVHLNPRNLWDFLSQIVAGDLEFFTKDGAARNACDRIRGWAESASFPEWYGRLFFNLLFEHPGTEHAGSDRGALFRALAEIDPKYTVSRQAHDLSSLAASDPEWEIQQTPGSAAAEWNAPDQKVQQDLKKAVSAGAVRRERFFPQSPGGESSAEENDLDAFLTLASAYQTYNLERRSSRELANFVTQFAFALGKAFGKAEGGLIYFQLENPLSQNRLPVWVEAPRLTRDSLEYEREDPLLKMADELHGLLRPMPRRIKIRFLDPDNHENRVRLDLDYPLFSLIRRVHRGYLAAPADMTERFHLRYVIQRWARMRAEHGAQLLVTASGKNWDVYGTVDSRADSEFDVEPEWQEVTS